VNVATMPAIPEWGADWSRENLTEQGVRLAELGYGIVRVYHPMSPTRCSCQKGEACGRNTGKHPTGNEWQKLAQHDPVRVRTLLGNPGNRSYGIIPPAGVFAWDVDGEVPEKLQALAADLGPLPPTRVHRSGKGKHVFYRWPESVPELRRGRNLFGIVTRWRGERNGMVIGPGSVHATTGRLYAVEADAEVAELPEAWAIAAGARKATEDRRPLPEMGVGDGRHDTVLEWARYTRGKLGIPRDAIIDMARIAGQHAGAPMTEDEIENAVGDVEQFSMDPPPIRILNTTPADAPVSIGQRTAADLRHGAPPPQLVGEMLTPEDATVLYGPGGTGKGVTACWLILRLVRSDHVVMVVDYEGHEREWGSRLRGLGATDDELSGVHYRAPFGADWTAPTGSLADVADAVRADANRLGVTYIVVDSYSVATSNGDTMGGQEAAREYFAGLTRIGLPSLTLAHVRGGAEKWPERPFGSVFVHNLSRETWAVEAIGTPSDPDIPRIGPHVVELEFRNRKPSGRPLAPPQFVTFEFYLDGSIEVREGRLAGPTVADLAADVLNEPMTLKQIAAAIKEDTGSSYSEDALRMTLKRHPERFEVSKDKRPAKWSRKP